MFQWSNKTHKSVAFNRGVADQSLLDLVEAALEKHPDKTFSHLCKEALWQFLGIPAAFQPRQAETPQPTPSADRQTGELKRLLTDFKQDFWARESDRDEAIESSLDRLSDQLSYLQQQLTHLEVLVERNPDSEPYSEQAVTADEAYESAPIERAEPRESDPVLDHLSQYLDEF